MSIARIAAGLRALFLWVLLGGAWCPAAADDWQDVLDRARGGTVFFNAWGGSEPVNLYLRWAAAEVRTRFGIDLKHVRIQDAGSVVSRVLAEQAAGRRRDGTVDLVWINGENFRAMKQQRLLLESWTRDLPNYALVDEEGKPTVLVDFSTPVDASEAPWGMAQLVFLYDRNRVARPPDSMAALLDFASRHPGRLTYPAPPGFHGTTFLKQALLELTPEPSLLERPASAGVDAITRPLWTFLNALHPHLWQAGRSFPVDASRMKQMLADGEILIALSFNPNEARNGIGRGELPASIGTYVHRGGTIGNTHFLAIPFNARAPDAAKVVVDFLLSPLAQARKADPAVWGDPTVLDLDRLSPQDRARFPADATDLPLRPEPHVSWVKVLEDGWQARYAR